VSPGGGIIDDQTGLPGYVSLEATKHACHPTRGRSVRRCRFVISGLSERSGNRSRHDRNPSLRLSGRAQDRCQEFRPYASGRPQSAS
jgi:hypothetical protein